MGLIRWRFGSQSTDRAELRQNRRRFCGTGLRRPPGESSRARPRGHGCCELHRTRGKVVFGLGVGCALDVCGRRLARKKPSRGCHSSAGRGPCWRECSAPPPVARRCPDRQCLVGPQTPGSFDEKSVSAVLFFTGRSAWCSRKSSAMGRFAAQVLLNSDQSLGQLRGRLHNFGGPVPWSSPIIQPTFARRAQRARHGKICCWPDPC